MKTKLYNLMNWADIEGIVYSEEDRPGNILGPHKVGNSVLYQAFFPDAKKVSLVIEGKEKKVAMDQADEEGFFAATAASALEAGYYYEVVTKEGKKEKRQDPYAFHYHPSREKLEAYKQGILYDSWKYFGCKKMKIDEKEGCSFLVRVPGAMRVSLVGEFSHWDGRRYPMNRVEGTDIFALFFPDFQVEQGYLYEVKKKDGSTWLMQDPYSILQEEVQGTVSKAYPESTLAVKNEKEHTPKEKNNPIVYSLIKEELGRKNILREIREMGFTHVSLPVYYPGKVFYQLPEYVESFQALKEFVEAAHKEDLGVIFKWQASQCDNLKEKENSNFYISNLLFLIQELTLDGVILSGLEELFYLDYKKSQGEWIPNIYGGNENLEGIELIKHMVSIIRRDQPEMLLLAGLDALWWGVTEALEKGGLGFDYCYDTAFKARIIGYLKAKEGDRHYHYSGLSQRADYAGEQNFIMAFDKEDLTGLWQEMEGSEEEKFEFLKAMISYISFLPGSAIQGFEYPADYKKEIDSLIKKCHQMKEQMIALGENEWENFIFINRNQSNEGTISFMKLSKEEENSFLVIANFSSVKKEEFFVGVPLEGKYRLIFDTKSKAFGGENLMLSQQAATVEEGWDGFNYKAGFTLEPYSLKVFSYNAYTEEEIMEMAVKRAEEIRKKLENEAKEKIARLRARKENLLNRHE